MQYNMFIDDERFPSDNYNKQFIICRSYADVDAMLCECGCPAFISFDHDLGENQPTGYDIAKHLVALDMSTNGNFIPENFDFYVHSQNPIGKKNIESYLLNYLDQRDQ